VENKPNVTEKESCNSNDIAACIHVLHQTVGQASSYFSAVSQASQAAQRSCSVGT